MRAILIQFLFESNTFNPAIEELALFTEGGVWLTSEAEVRQWDACSQLKGSLVTLEAAGWETAPVFAAVCRTPGGRLSAACFERIRRTLREAIRAALPADAILLHLHGAACAVGEDDVEGNLLAMVREELAFAGTLVLSLDLHANVTRRMLSHADVVTAYRTMPHVDFMETGERAARLALGFSGPRTRILVKINALIPPTSTRHDGGFFARILQMARALEALPGIEDASVFPVQPWLDVEELGTSIVLTCRDPHSAEKPAERLGGEWFGQRHQWTNGLMSWDEIKGRLYSGRKDKPWMLVDTADATTGGSPGQSAEAVWNLLPDADKLPGEVLLWVVAPAAVEAAATGAASFVLGSRNLEARVLRVTDCGRFRARGGGYTGQEFSMGKAAVLSRGKLRIVLSGEAVLASDPAFFECLGLQPDKALAVHVKSLGGWMGGYRVSSEQGLYFDGPGCTSLNFRNLPFQKSRPFPIDPNPPAPVTLWQSI